MQPRVDNTMRALEFARSMEDDPAPVQRTHGTSLALRAGLDAGHVTSGLVGRSSVIYDMWGEAVNLAHRVQAAGYGPGVYVSQQVYDRLRDTVDFEEAPAIETRSGREPVWRVVL